MELASSSLIFLYAVIFIYLAWFHEKMMQYIIISYKIHQLRESIRQILDHSSMMVETFNRLGIAFKNLQNTIRDAFGPKHV